MFYRLDKGTLELIKTNEIVEVNGNQKIVKLETRFNGSGNP
jgi:hypothetical protein